MLYRLAETGSGQNIFTKRSTLQRFPQGGEGAHLRVASALRDRCARQFARALAIAGRGRRNPSLGNGWRRNGWGRNGWRRNGRRRNGWRRRQRDAFNGRRRSCRGRSYCCRCHHTQAWTEAAVVHSYATAAISCRCRCSYRNGSRCHRCGCCCCCCTAAPKWADGSTRASWTGRAAVAGKSACPTRSVYLSTCIPRVMQLIHVCGVSERSIRITFLITKTGSRQQNIISYWKTEAGTQRDG